VRIGAIFVDAGYLFSVGSDVVFGQVHRRRDLLLQDPGGLLEKLTSITEDCCDDESLRILRTYWYDGAVNGLPVPDQIAVGSLSRVKLRLGRINAGGQKGVDGLIILDLITLATNRAIDTAIVVSGDEDLREAAVHAQSFGVSVVLVGLPPTRQQRQSELLIREADHHLVLDTAVMATHLELSSARSIPQVEQAPAGTHQATALLPDGDTTARLRKVADELVADPRFGRLEEIVSSDGSRLTRRADRILVARLAELTGLFPVEKQLLERARAATVEAAVAARGGLAAAD
jgi:NYN domain